jgi:hypothetical protein
MSRLSFVGCHLTCLSSMYIPHCPIGIFGYPISDGMVVGPSTSLSNGYFHGWKGQGYNYLSMLPITFGLYKLVLKGQALHFVSLA